MKFRVHGELAMQTAKWVLAISLAAVFQPACFAGQGDGLTVREDSLPWSRWQARVAVTSPAPLWRAGFGDVDQQGLRPPRGVSLMGDYLFTRSLADDGRTSYLRASSGLVIGPRSDLPTVQPYLGIGYSGMGARGSGWSFNADFGLMALGSSNAVRLGRTASGQGLDDLVRELRLSPVLLFGASYAF
jgi:hypothetical protein